MKVLIASVTAGHGHHSAAAAVAGLLTQRGHETVTIDLIKEIGKPLYLAIDKGYNLSINLTPRQYGNLYRKLEADSVLRRSVVKFFSNDLIANRANNKIQTIDPDVVITTHPVAAQVIGELISNGFLQALHVGIVTDYTILPIWEDPKNIDYIVTCGPAIEPRAIARGIPSEKLLPIGIPIQTQFLKNTDSSEAKRSLGLQTHIPAALVMGGSMGYGKIEAIVKDTIEHVVGLQLLVVCGRSDKLLKKLRALDLPDTVSLMGFVDNIDVLMDASDFIVTKPGGLSISESLQKNKPMILFDPIPGQEEANADYLVNYGMAMRSTKNTQVWELIKVLVTNPKRLEMMKESISTFAETNSTPRLVDFLEKTVTAKSSG
jgi:processive 1,2-diacylglycerol beta-glucosyltransferase